jgi:hypothetical protein
MPAVITQQGALNTTALIVPDAYVQIIPPAFNYFNGLPTNIVGIVGTAAWGPVNTPVTIGSMQGYAQQFGALQNRKYDLGTQLATAVQQGANNFRCVRVTDGSDTAAAVTLGLAGTVTPTTAGTGNAVNDVLTLSNGVTVKVTAVASGGVTAAVVESLGVVTASATGLGVASSTGAGTGAVFSLSVVDQIALTSLYTGSLGNLTQVTLSAGSSSTAATPSYKLTVAMPGVQEVFDNIAGTGTGAALWTSFWTNLANAVNNGITALRGPSRLIVAGAGTSPAAPLLGTYSLAGGSDGALSPALGGNVTAATLVGQDSLPRKGMYALRTLGCSVAWLADADDDTQWANQVEFATSEFVYVIGTGPSADTISNALAAKQSAGIDSPWFKLIFGDWVYWSDTVNNVLRLVSPQGFIGGLLGNLAPQNSSLNKPMQGIVGTQKTGPAANGNSAYAYADLQQLIGGGIEVVANPCPGGNYFGAQSGHNSSSDATRNTDAYTRLTDYISTSLGAASGVFVGQLQTAQQQLNAKAAINAFFQSLQDAGQIGTSSGSAAYNVTLDSTNNPAARVALGYEQADIQVSYLNVVEKFLVNFQGGGSVQIASNQT